VRIVYPLMSPIELLRYIGVELGMSQPTSEANSIDRVLKSLIECMATLAAAGRAPVIVIDDAHTITDRQVWQSIQLLLNFQHVQGVEFALILSGAPELAGSIKRMPQLDDRISIPCVLTSFSDRETARRYRVLNHHARELSEHRALGKTAAGTPVYIDERFVSAELHITLGFIEPHLMLGYSGGRKLIAPGLAAQETIKVLHSSRFMRDARAAEGSIADNPLHRLVEGVITEIRAVLDVEFEAADGAQAHDGRGRHRQHVSFAD